MAGAARAPARARPAGAAVHGGVALATGVLFGLAPAWSAFASAPISALRETGSAGERKSRRLFGQGLVAAQVALSVVLLSAAGLLVGHLSNLRNLNLGFQRESVLLVTLDPRQRLRPDAADASLPGAARSAPAIPGVQSATLAAVTPIEGGAASRFATVEGFEEQPEERRLWLNWVGPKYFETLGTPWWPGAISSSRTPAVHGWRSSTRRWCGATSPAAVLSGGISPSRATRPYEIVGVAGDAKYADLHEVAPATVYFNAFQDGEIASQFAIRTRAPAAVATRCAAR